MRLGTNKKPEMELGRPFGLLTAMTADQRILDGIGQHQREPTGEDGMGAKLEYRHLSGSVVGGLFVIELPVPGDEAGFVTMELPPKQAAEVAKWINAQLREMRAAPTDEAITPEVNRQTFDRFWQAYPKKVGVAECRAEWAKQRAAQHIGEILQHIDELRATDSWQKGFILDPVRYLKRRRWEDVNASDRVDPMGGVL